MKKTSLIKVLSKIMRFNIVLMIFLTMGLSLSYANNTPKKEQIAEKSLILTINGTVKDGATQEPIVGASVLLKGTSKGSITDVSGNFSLAIDEKEKNGILVISFVGYDKQEVSLNGQVTINIALKSGANLDEVVVSASRKAEKVQEAPASVSVINSKTLQAASSAIDPIRELANVAGIQIQQQSAATMNISMRGSADLFSTSADNSEDLQERTALLL